MSEIGSYEGSNRPEQPHPLELIVSVITLGKLRLLRKLKLENYRCFDNHTVTFHPSTVVVGKNNAGKSTIVEALHLVASVINRNAASFVPVPAYSSLNRFQKCICPKTVHLGLDFRTVFHRYGEPPAVITATFTGDSVATVYVHPEGIYATIRGPVKWITTSAGFDALEIPRINILPQVSPLQADETLRNEEYVKANNYTKLASRHFRNQMFLQPESFENFKDLAERTWHGLRVEEVQRDGVDLSMFVTDGDFAAEVAWMGHGLQMWLQTIWFIAKTSKKSIIVLDEPDVYMHPDLQRKVYRLIRSRFDQSIIATHSIEIMAEADPSDILIVNNKRRRSEYANTEPAVQFLIDGLGGIHNVHLARLWNSKKVLLLEGKDIAFLKVFHTKLFPDVDIPLDAIPNLSIGGWGGWSHAVGSSMALKNAVGESIITYCILDSDYHTDVEQQDRYKQATERGINLHIWRRKEIENYLIEPAVIARVLKLRLKSLAPTAELIEEFLLSACEAEKDVTLDGIASSQDRSLGVGGANKAARERLNSMWKDQRLHVVCGKSLLARLSTWTQKDYGTSIGAMAIARAFQPNEIQDEIREVLRSIEDGKEFSIRSS
jgi:predicted ATPase